MDVLLTTGARMPKDVPDCSWCRAKCFGGTQPYARWGRADVRVAVKLLRWAWPLSADRLERRVPASRLCEPVPGCWNLVADPEHPGGWSRFTTERKSPYSVTCIYATLTSGAGPTLNEKRPRLVETMVTSSSGIRGSSRSTTRSSLGPGRTTSSSGSLNETPAARVADLGCGTGRLTLALAAAGHQVTGVDPARASLDAARTKPGAEHVTWIEGTPSALGEAAFDMAVMTAHVTKFLVDDQDWHGTLRDLYRALVPGGRLVFDTRDPRARIWEHWNPRESRQRVLLHGGTFVEVWNEVTSVDDDLVSSTLHYLLDGREELLSTATMRFRSEQAVRDAVRRAGMDIQEVYGGWNREPVGSADGELLVAHADRTSKPGSGKGRKQYRPTALLEVVRRGTSEVETCRSWNATVTQRFSVPSRTGLDTNLHCAQRPGRPFSPAVPPRVHCLNPPSGPRVLMLRVPV